MYALFKPELLDLARAVYQQQAAFEAGGIDESALKELQLDRLKEVVRYVKAGSAFYKTAAAKTECNT